MRLFVLGLVGGAFWLQSQPALPVTPAWQPVLLALGGALGAILLMQQRARPGQTAAGLVWFVCGVLLGGGYAQHRANLRLAESLPTAWEGRDLVLTGAIASLPTVTERGTRFVFHVESTETSNAVVPSRLSLTWYHDDARRDEPATPAPTLAAGERWQLTVRLRRPHGTANPHAFDFEAWALERSIRATGYVRFKGVNRKLAQPANGLGYDIDRARQAVRMRMLASLGESPFAGVLVALAIGEQNAIPAAQWKTFWRTGTGHLMSISGLHITMVAALLYWLAFRLWARAPSLVARIPAQRAAAVVGALSALAYSLLAGFSVPTQRTFFMLLVVALALLLGRGLTASRVLALALFAVVLIDPWCVLSPGFWLSFGAVAMIFYVTAHHTGPSSWFATAIRTQVAVTLGLLPLTLALFQEVSVISPIANAIAIPVVSWVVVPLTLAGALLPFEILLHVSHSVMSATFTALAWLAALPVAVWQSHAPQAWTVFLAIAGVLWLLLPRGVPLRIAGLVALLPMFLVLPAAPKPGEMWVTLLDVGQGLATVVRTATRTLVYDTGPQWNPDADSGNRIVVPYLRGEGIRTLDALVVTHDDEDHYGGARSVIDARNPSWVLTSSPKEREYLSSAREVMRCEVGDGWRWDGVEFDVLHPTSAMYDEARKTNNMGCVLKITAPGGTVLMTADIEKLVEGELIAHDVAALKADVLIVPHHGSKSSSTDAFIDAVQPTLALLPVGYRNRFRHPHPMVEARYVERKIPILRTDWEGAITLKFPASADLTPTVIRHRQQIQRYWTDMPTKSISDE